jgi:hypothetical protein
MSGSGPASTLAYSETLSGEAANLQTIAATSTASGAATYGASWRGTGAAASATSQTALDTQHELLATALLEKVPHVAAAAAAHQTALASMVTAEQAVANRMEEAADQQINLTVLGALSPRIAALNVEYYGHMWPRNAAAGAAYGAALRASTAALLVPFPPAVAGASAAAPAIAAAGLAENAAMSAAGATMQAGEQAVQAAMTPAAAVSQVAATGRAAPMAAPQNAGQPKPPQAPTGMFARPPQAAVPAAPNSATPGGQGLTPAQFDQAVAARAETLSPRPGSVPGPSPVGSYTGAGLTSYVRPSGDGFTPPPAEQAGGARPGMLNAATLPGPVMTAPLTTSSPTPAQPLAYVHPEPPRPTVTASPPPPKWDLGDTAQTLKPPPQPPQPPPPPPPSPEPAAPQSGPPGPPPNSEGPGGPGGPGAQMLGSGPGDIPQAPPTPMPPLAPRPPVPPPPPPSPGEPPLRPPTPPSWASPPVPKSVEAAQRAYEQLIKDIERHNSWRPDPTNLDAVNAYNQEAWTYNSWKSQLERQLNTGNTQYTPGKEAVRTDIPSWTQPAPEQPHMPGGQQPGATSPSLADQAAEIGREVAALPKGTRLDTLADKVTGLHLDQEQAVEATDIAAKAAFGETGGIANLPDGTRVVLPKLLPQRVAMMVHPDGSVTVFKGDLSQFLPYLGK